MEQASLIKGKRLFSLINFRNIISSVYFFGIFNPLFEQFTLKKKIENFTSLTFCFLLSRVNNCTPGDIDKFIFILNTNINVSRI